jgi:hypothetical protein
MTFKTSLRFAAAAAIQAVLVGSSVLIPMAAFVQSAQAATSTPATTTPNNTNAPAQFIPLTQLPGLSDTSTTSTLPGFLNQLYKICIGVAAVIAVLEIMYAGVQFMTSRGSVSSNEAAKSRIQNAILGLVLVLSPTIVFSIINPDILKLDLNFSTLDPSTNKNSSGKVDTTLGPNGVPIAGDNSGTPTVTVTGTLLRTGTFPTEAAMNTFIGQCSSLAKATLIGNIAADDGKATTKGCTKTCTPSGQGACDAKGCSQYTAYCSVVSSATLYTTTKQPIAQDTYKWNQFTSGCQAAGGNPKDTYSTNQTTNCFDGDDKPTTCVLATLSCDPK